MPAASSRSRPISPTRCAACWPIRSAGRRCPTRSPTGCGCRRDKSVLPKRGDLLVETFPRGNRFYMVAYPFEGRLAHQTLGMLLTRRLERAGARAARLRRHRLCARRLGARATWARCSTQGQAVARRRCSTRTCWATTSTPGWRDSWLLKRTFRNCALISGLIEKRHPGQEKTGRQVTVSADLIYDVLRSHEPDHILLQATRADAATGLLDVSRLADMLSRIKGQIMHKDLDHISPLAVPIMLEIGKERVDGEAERYAAVGGGRRSDRGGDGTQRDHGTAVTGAEPTSLPGAARPRSRSPARRRCATGAARSISPTCGLLCVSDLHLEKGSSLARRGMLAAALRHGRDAAQAAGHHRRLPARASWSASATVFTTASGAARLPSQMRRDLSAHDGGRDWFWVAGNHDPDAAGRPAGRHGRRRWRVGALTLPPRTIAEKRRRARSPATCIPARASCSAGARCAAAASPPTASASSCRPSAPIPARSTCSIAPMPGCSAEDGLIAYMIGASKLFAISGAMLRPG